MIKYLIAASLSIFINFCAIGMEPEERLEPKRKDNPIYEKIGFDKALQNAASNATSENINKIVIVLDYLETLRNTYLPARVAYAAYTNGSLDSLVNSYQYLPADVSPEDFDTILYALSKQNKKNSRNKQFMEDKIKFDTAAATRNIATIIDIFSRGLLQKSYLPAKLAYAVYKENARGILISQNELPSTLSLQQFENILVLLAEVGNNNAFITFYSMKNTIPVNILRIDQTGHIVLPPASNIKPRAYLDSSYESSSDESSLSD
jgi:hypothetical protein